mmetsp:Transcript_3274/g.8097  ORF Transcript_3274/g.8097 Transcript_3274/m.8097 type:complete len:446 (+) Transcript_3274:346-1683(+)
MKQSQVQRGLLWAGVGLGVLALSASLCGAQTTGNENVTESTVSDLLCQEGEVAPPNAFVSVCSATEKADFLTGDDADCDDPVPLGKLCEDMNDMNSISGAIRGAPVVEPSYFEFVMYWAPTFCEGEWTGNETNPLCSEYTNAYTPASTQLSILSLEPRYSPSAQPEYCASQSLGNFSMCGETAGMNASECEEIKEESGTKDLRCGEECWFTKESSEKFNISEGWQTFAPAWAGPNDASNAGNIAWMKYGSCMGKNFDEFEFAEQAIKYESLVISGPGLVFSSNLGKSVNASDLQGAFPNNTGIFSCNADCEIEFVTMCIENKDGSLGYARSCPEESMDDSCSKCSGSINVPQYDGQNITAILEQQFQQGWSDFQSQVQNVTDQARDYWGQVQDTVQTRLPEIIDTIRNTTQTAVSELQDVINSTVSELQSSFQQGFSGLQDVFNG